MLQKQLLRDFQTKYLNNWKEKTDLRTQNKVQRATHELDRYEWDSGFRSKQFIVKSSLLCGLTFLFRALSPRKRVYGQFGSFTDFCICFEIKSTILNGEGVIFFEGGAFFFGMRSKKK